MEKLLLSVVAFLGVILSLNFKGHHHKVISLGLACCILILWTNNGFWVSIGFIGLFICSVLSIIYGLKISNLNKLEKTCIVTVGLFVAISLIFKIIHLPGAMEIRLIFAFPVLTSLIYFIRSRELTKEMSFMLFWGIYATMDFLKFWTA